MAVEIIFPRVDMDMASGRFSRWLVEEGAAVGKGEPLFEIETDKAAMEIEAPAGGVLRGVKAAAGEEVQVGAPVGWIVADGEAWSEMQEGRLGSAQTRERAVALSKPEFLQQSDSGGSALGGVDGRHATACSARPPLPSLRATPLARREAERLGIDLHQVTGSGPRGRIVAQDLVRQDGLHRRWAGSGQGTPLVFLHGFGADLTGWRPLWRGLEATHRLLAIDLPGHGGSQPGPDVSLDGLVGAVRQVLEQERVTGCILVGHSLGGAVALGLADGNAVDIRGLVLLSPAGLGPEIDGAFLSGLIRAGSAESLAPWLERLVADPALVTPAFVRASLAGRSEARTAYWRRLADTLFPDGTQAIALRSVLARLTMPVKLVWGSQDRIVPVSHAAHLPGQIALHRLDAGHMPHLEQPRLLAGLIAELARASG